MAKLKITQTRSAIGQSKRHRGTLRALGLGGEKQAAETLAGVNGTTEAAEEAQVAAEEEPA